MSSFGGGGQRSSGSSRTGGRGGRGGRHHSGGRGSYHHHGDGGPTSGGGKGRLTACRNYISGGTCSHGDNCSFSHAVKLHACMDGSNVPSTHQQQQQQQYGSSRSSSYTNGYSSPSSKGTTTTGLPEDSQAMAVSSVALWEDSASIIKIFSGSYDGHWRLWNTAANFSREFEHCMSPTSKVNVVRVSSHQNLYVAFDSPIPGIIPLAYVGMVHIWNLLMPQQPPIELHLQPGLAPYANGMGVSSLLPLSDNTLLTGGRDGSIGIWSLQQQQQQQQQQLTSMGPAPTEITTTICYRQSKLLLGHAREVTALLSVTTNTAATPTPTTVPTTTTTVLWSSSTDGTIRLWDIAGGVCLCVLSSDTKDSQGRLVGHTSAVTSLRLWESAEFGNYVLSAGLDGCIKAWSTEGVLIASSSDTLHAPTTTTSHPATATTTTNGVVCMAISHDAQSQPLLLCGLMNGEIAIRSIKQTSTTPAFTLLMTLNSRYLGCGHLFGAVRCLETGPHSTFYSGGEDGKLNVWQVTGDFGLQ
jgi:WD40 repeat protein